MTKRKSLKSNSGPVKKYQNGDPVYDTDDREMLQQYFSNQLIPHFEQTYGAAEAVTKALEWLQGKYPDAYKALVKPKSIDVNDATGRIPGILANLPLSAISAPSAFFAETLDDQPGINLERALGMGSEPQLSIGNSLGIQSPILSLGVDLAFDPLNLATGAGIIKAAKSGLKALKYIPRTYEKVATGNSRIPIAWKVGKHNSSEYEKLQNLRPFTSTEKKAVETYAASPHALKTYGAKFSEDLRKLPIDNPTDLKNTESPITRILNYHIFGQEPIPNKYGSIFKYDDNVSWSLGYRKYQGNGVGPKNQRIIIPNRYAKHLNTFTAFKPGVTGFKGEREIFGNVPEGFKVIGRSIEKAKGDYHEFENIFVKPIIKKLKGGFIPSSPLGQWKYPGQTVNVPSNNITMKGINHPNLGIGDNGIIKMMFPGKNYNFPGAKSVTEIPIMQDGGYTSDPKAEGKSKDVDYDSLLEYIKEVEGFVSEPYWDVKQWTVGYGTKAQGKNDKVDEKEALKRLKEDLKMRKKYVKDYSEKHGYKWTPTQLDALTSFVYNLGLESLDQLTDNGTRDETTIAKKILEYNNVRNDKGKLERSPGLTKRRKFESDLFSGLGGDILDFFHGSPMAHVEVTGEGTKMDSLPTIQSFVQSLNPTFLGLPKKFQDGDFAQMPQDNTAVNRPMIMGEDPENVLPVNEQRRLNIDQALDAATAPFKYGFPMIPINIPGVMDTVKPALQKYAYENLPFTELGSGEFFPDSRLWYPSPPGVNFAYDEDEPKDWSKSALMKEIFTLVKNNDKKNLQWIDDIAKDENYKEWTEYKPAADLYAMYLNQDQPFGTIRKSGFKPSDSKDPNAQYYAMSEDIEKNIYSDTIREFEKLNKDGAEFEIKNGFYKVKMSSNALGEFTSWYNPETGEVRYMDSYDLDRIPFADAIIGKPFEIYNRINFRGQLKQSNTSPGGGSKYWEEMKSKNPEKFSEYEALMKKLAKLDSLENATQKKYEKKLAELDSLENNYKYGGYLRLPKFK